MRRRCFRCGRFVGWYHGWSVWFRSFDTCMSVVNVPACARHAGFSYGIG